MVFGSRRSAALVAILAGAWLTACGQRGPLYLPVPPSEPAPRVRSPSSGTVIVPRTPEGPKAGERTAAPTDDRPARRTD